jgi:hypothetical protein
MSLISLWRPKHSNPPRKDKKSYDQQPPLQALRRILRLSGHRPRFHGFRDLGSVFRCCGFIYRTNVIFGERAPGDNESNRGGRQNWEPKLTGDHETNHWREAAPVARLTLISGHFSRRLEERMGRMGVITTRGAPLPNGTYGTHGTDP